MPEKDGPRRAGMIRTSAVVYDFYTNYMFVFTAPLRQWCLIHLHGSGAERWPHPQGERIMIATKSIGAALVVALAAAGCATQSSSFRQMSAADHEAAARAASDSAVAEEHTEAASRLRDEERSACYGVSDADRDQGPFARADGVTGVEVVRDRGVFPKGPLEPVGVAVYLRAESGMTQQWLGRVVACHQAHLAVVGSERQHSPLSVPNADVSVSSTQVGFRVTITSRDRDAARSVVERGRELAQTSPATIAWY
jgi:hypothetical protein